MSNTPHLLADEFAAQGARLQMLQDANPHFARLCRDYDAVNRAVHRAETRVDTIAEDAEQTLRRERARLKDEIARMLAG